MTALENLRFFASLYAGPTQDPMRVLEMVHLHDDAHTRVAQYSKGMMMRLNIARSLIHNPELLFFDEPTSGLDPANAKRVKQLILQLKEQGKTVFLTTHNMQVVDEVCDRVAFIVDGSIALIASPRELKVKHGERTVAVVVREDQSLKKREFPLDCLGDNPDFIRLLKEAEVETIHTKEATLEDIFIQVTGRELV